MLDDFWMFFWMLWKTTQKSSLALKRNDYCQVIQQGPVTKLDPQTLGWSPTNFGRVT